MNRRTHVLAAAALCVAMAGCGGGGGGSGGNGAAQDDFITGVQRTASTNSDEAEPAELTAEPAADSGADAEPLPL